jgi:uncharacterized membrane protein YphA (DoxX/SURF4 family)
VNALLARVDRWFLAPAPAERLAALRILVGSFATIYLAIRVPYVLDVADLPRGRFEPVGVAAVLDAPLATAVVRVVLLSAVLAGVLFVVGWRHRVVAPTFALLLLASLTYSNSWQHIAHTENLVLLHVAVLAVVPAADVWSLDARRAVAGTDARRAAGPVTAPGSGYGWPIQLMSMLTVVTYVLAGVAKVRHGGVDWVDGDVLRNLVAHDNLRKIVLGDVHSPIGGWLVGHGWVFPPLAALSLAVELGAPLALLRGRFRQVWIVAAWCFHLGVLALMAILFPYPLSGIAFASFLRPERLLTRVARAVRRPATGSGALTAYRRGDVG